MGFVKNLMHKIKKNRDMKPLKNENLNYNDNLIAMLKNDHEELFTLYRSIQEQFKSDSDFEKMKSVMNDFKVALEIHLMVEDAQLYGYIKNINQDNEMTYEFVNDVQKEMAKVAKKVLLFIDKYTNEKKYAKQSEHFLDDLGEVGMVLTQRFDMEEKQLYSLYKAE